MNSSLGQSIRRARKERGLTPQALAQRLGYTAKGVNKGARRIQQIEREGLEDERFIGLVLDALGLDRGAARRLAQIDEARRREAWERWADEPIRPMLVLRFGPHWFLHCVRDVPPAYTSLADCERYAAGVIRRHSQRRKRRGASPATGRLIWSRRLHVWFDEQGRVKRRNNQTYEEHCPLPHGEVGNKAFVLC